MATAVLKEKAMGYFSLLDDRKAQKVISYMEAMRKPAKKGKKTLLDLKGKVDFAEGYDYKAMRSAR